MDNQATETPKDTSQQQQERVKGGRRKKRDMRFPGCENKIWRRKGAGGWAGMPKTLLLIAQLMGKVEKDSMLPLTMIGLWLATWDDGFVDVQSEHQLALDCGFTQNQPNRRAFEWRERVRKLEKLGFVETAPQDSVNINYILIKDPHRAISNLYAGNGLPKELEEAAKHLRNTSLRPLLERLRDKAIDVGAMGIESLLENPEQGQENSDA